MPDLEGVQCAGIMIFKCFFFLFYAWFLRGIVASGLEILHKNFTLLTKVSFAAPYSDTLFECAVSGK